MEKKYNTKTKEQEEHQEFVNLDESTQGEGFGVFFFFFSPPLVSEVFYHLLISIRNRGIAHRVWSSPRKEV